MSRPESAFRDDLELRSVAGRTGVFTTTRIPAGHLILRLQGPPQKQPSPHTIQVDESVHLDESGFVDGETNHACAPSAYVDLADPSRPAIRALDSIPAGSEVTINYCASEDEMAEPFQCRCGAEECYGWVRGYAHLTVEQRRSLRGQVSPLLLKKYGDPWVATHPVEEEDSLLAGRRSDHQT